MDLKNYIDSIKDWPQEGINFKDISPILANPKAFELARIGEISLKLMPSCGQSLTESI